MRDRYVLQVLLATLGTGVLMALIAVVETPRDGSQSSAVPTQTSEFKNECALPFRTITDCPGTTSQATCVMGSTQNKKCKERGRKTVPLKHC